MRALSDWIVVLGLADTTIGKTQTIIAPPNRRFYPLPSRGKVISVGPGKRIGLTEERAKPCVNVGDLVIFKQTAGYQIERGDKAYVFLKEKDILCRLEGMNMIRKVKGGYKVVSESGKNLGGPYKSRKDAQKRLRHVEYFKHKKNR